MEIITKTNGGNGYTPDKRGLISHYKMDKTNNIQPSKKNQGLETSRSYRVAFLIGVGIMAAVDEIVFHQILSWHHFYDRSTQDWALFSDGLLHAAELIAVVAGFFFLSDLRRRHQLAPLWAWAGFFVGAGVFQLFDGIIDHKILRVHQIRYGVDDLLYYDLAWNGAALLLIWAGFGILKRARSWDNKKGVEN